MKTLAETLVDHKNTAAYAMAVNGEGMIPEVGNTIYNDQQSMVCTSVDINRDGLISIVFDNGQKVSGTQVADMVAGGIIRIK